MKDHFDDVSKKELSLGKGTMTTEWTKQDQEKVKDFIKSVLPLVVVAFAMVACSDSKSDEPEAIDT